MDDRKCVFWEYHKSILMESKWNDLKCAKCDSELELVRNNKYESVKKCPECGYRCMLIRKLRREFDE